jgi:phage gp36-like protein
MPYAASSDILARYDARRVGELVRDDATRASPSELATDPVLTALLADASAIVDSAALAGGRYSADDLSALAADPVGGPLLVRLVCDLAFGLLVSRRGAPASDVDALAPRYKAANDVLEALRNGGRVLDVAGAIAAGQPVNTQVDSDVTLVTQFASRLFGEALDYTLPPKG